MRSPTFRNNMAALAAVVVIMIGASAAGAKLAEEPQPSFEDAAKALILQQQLQIIELGVALEDAVKHIEKLQKSSNCV